MTDGFSIMKLELEFDAAGHNTKEVNSMRNKLLAFIRNVLDEASYLFDELLWRLPAVLVIIFLSAVTALATILTVEILVSIAARS